MFVDRERELVDSILSDLDDEDGQVVRDYIDKLSKEVENLEIQLEMAEQPQGRKKPREDDWR